MLVYIQYQLDILQQVLTYSIHIQFLCWISYVNIIKSVFYIIFMRPYSGIPEQCYHRRHLSSGSYWFLGPKLNFHANFCDWLSISAISRMTSSTMHFVYKHYIEMREDMGRPTRSTACDYHWQSLESSVWTYNVVFCSGYSAPTLFRNLKKRSLACRERGTLKPPHIDMVPSYPPPEDALGSSVGLSHGNLHQYTGDLFFYFNPEV